MSNRIAILRDWRTIRTNGGKDLGIKKTIALMGNNISFSVRTAGEVAGIFRFDWRRRCIRYDWKEIVVFIKF